jgi:hypothetical protein
MDLIDVDGSQRAVFPPGFSDGKDFCAGLGNSVNFVDGFAPLPIPDGAVMTGLRVSYIDDGNSPELNGRVKVVRMPFGAGTFRELLSADLTNTGAPAEKATAVGVVTGGTTTAQLTIDHGAYMYDLVLDQGTNLMSVCGMRVTFTT